ncbi:MAG: GHKL domain-containing protein [Cytophagia bacterium]|nr:MAG: GHKL domain-containing protein [Cytophagales bacterium]TAG37729.1 MAG: GHKL domain-containing protein [Cytophagia bacterium]TAG78900.1 MAG: GHKL domain-containing protein [Cytophagales bacterium]
MKKLVFFLLVSVQVGLAQKQGQALIDSLVKVLPKIQNDTLKARTYNRIVNEYLFINTEKALYYSKIGLTHAQKMRWQKGIGVFWGNIGQAYSDKGLHDSSTKYYQQAVGIYRQIGDKRNLASTLNNLGAAESNNKSNYVKATQYYLQALKEAEAIPDTFLIGLCHRNIGNVYAEQNNFAKALQYVRKSLQIAQQRNKNPDSSTNRELAWSLAGLANIYLQTKDFRQASVYLNQSLPLFETLGDAEGLASIYNDLATASDTNYPQKIIYAQKAVGLWEQTKPMSSDAIGGVGNLGMAYFDYVRYQKPKNKNALLPQAKKYFLLAINRSKQKGEVANEAFWVGALAELQAFEGDYRNAYLNFRHYQAAQDSLFSQESKNKIAEVESQREIEIRDKQIKINELELNNQKKQRVGLLIGLGLLAVIGGLLYWQSQTRKRTNTTLLHLNQELDEANKIKAKFFAILSHDLRSPVANLITFLNLQKQAPDLLPPDVVETNQNRITESAEVLLENMESMLLWSKSQMAHFKPQIKEIAVNELFAYIQHFFADNTGVNLHFKNPADLQVNTDEDYLKIIMQNLTSNALKALKNVPDGRICWEARQEKGKVVLAISDNAGGITEQQLSTLYTDTTAVSGKTGLGLHLIRDLAKAIACQISVSATPHIGTEFRLAFVTQPTEGQ